MKQFPRFFFLLPFLLILPFSGCREATFESAWSERPVIIDGRYSEWTAPIQYFDKPSMYMSFRNDRNDLFILIKAVDRRAQLKVLRLGMTIWFDSPDKKEKAWGVHYPVGLVNPGISRVGRDIPGDFTVQQREQAGKMLEELALLKEGTPEKVQFRNDAADSAGYGIKAAARDTSDVIVYELRVPLRGNGRSPFEVTPDAGGSVSLRLETGDIRPGKWTDPREDSLRVDNPMDKLGSGTIRDKNRRTNRSRRELTPPPNPLTEPIRFSARVTLAPSPGMTGKSMNKEK